MKSWIRNLALGSLVGTSALWGCSNKDPATAVTAQVSIPERAIMAYIPKDTPYLFMGTEALPKELIDKGLSFFQEVGKMEGLDLEKDLEKAKQNGDESAKAFLEMLQNKDQSVWQQIGVSPQGKMTLYGLGLLPVFRLELSDVEKARSFFKKFKSGIDSPWTQKQLGDQSYEELAFENGLIAVAFVKNELVIAFALPEVAEQVLKIAFLQEKPAQAFNDMSTLNQLARDFGLRYSMGYIDNRILGDLFMGRSTGINSTVMKTILKDVHIELSETCSKELDQLKAKTPRFVFGLSDDVSANRVKLKLGVELEETLAKDLSSIATDGMGMNPKAKLLSLSVGFKYPNLVAFVQKSLDAIKAAPYQCEYLLPLNDLANELPLQMLLPFNNYLNDFSSLSIAMNDVDIPKKVDMTIMMTHAHPEKLLNMSNLFLGASDLGLNPDGKTVDLSSMIPQNLDGNEKLFVRMTPNAIGVAVTTTDASQLASMMETKGEPGVLLSMKFGMDLAEQGMDGFAGYVEKSRTRLREELKIRLTTEEQVSGREGMEKIAAAELGQEKFAALKAKNPEFTIDQAIAELYTGEAGAEMEKHYAFMKRYFDSFGAQLRLTPKGILSELWMDLK